MTELPQLPMSLSPSINVSASEELQFDPFMLNGMRCHPSEHLHFGAYVVEGEVLGAMLLLGRGDFALSRHLGADTCRHLADMFVAMAGRIEASAAQRAAAALDRAREAGHGS